MACPDEGARKHGHGSWKEKSFPLWGKRKRELHRHHSAGLIVAEARAGEARDEDGGIEVQHLRTRTRRAARAGAVSASTACLLTGGARLASKEFSAGDTWHAQRPWRERAAELALQRRNGNNFQPGSSEVRSRESVA